VDLAEQLGTDAARAGFTGTTGNVVATQDITGRSLRTSAG
jgi:hypothetical protein